MNDEPTIRAVAIDMHSGYANRPTLRVLLDFFPEAYQSDNGYYRQAAPLEDPDNHVLAWRRTLDGWVHFFSLNLRGAHGHGPSYRWASRAGVMNQYFPFTVEAALFTEEAAFLKGGGRSGAFVLSSIVGLNIMRMLREQGVEIDIEVDGHSEATLWFETLRKAYELGEDR
jgi:hypothetical protein